MKPLLLLVDLQEDYLATPGLEPSAGSVVRAAQRLLEGCRERGVAVVHLWTTVTRGQNGERDERMPHWRAQDRWHCVAGTPGHAPPNELAPQEGEAIVHKTGFSGFTRPELPDLIAKGGYDTLIVAGVHLHACVREAVLGAYERGLEVWVADGATGSDDPVHAAITRRYLAARATRFAPIDDLLARLDDQSGHLPPSLASVPIPIPVRIPIPVPSWTSQKALEHLPQPVRIAAFAKLADRLEADAEVLALGMADAIGKPILYGEGEVRRTAAMLRAVIRRVQDDALTNHGDPPEVRHQPLGCVAVITPWNNPYYIPLSKVGPALLYGNTVAWKPAPVAHAMAETVRALLVEACPALAGALTVIEGGREAAERLMNHPATDAVTLTGSLETGYSAHEICARRHLPYQAELGGNNASIVWEDADLPGAARLIAEGAFGLAGQRCTAGRRVIVHAGCAEAFLSLLEQEIAKLPWGDPRQRETRVGPMVSAAHRTRFAQLVEAAARSLGSPLLVPHGKGNLGPDPAWGHEGAWQRPVVLRCEDPDHEIVQKESFGPLLVVQTARSWEEAMALLNGVSQGLSAALFSTSESLAQRFLAEARAGILKVNLATADAGLDLPFGGWKSSGCGPPEHGRFDREFYTRPQTVYRGDP